MISGALFLDENYEFSLRKIRNHIMKMLLFFVFWSMFYACFRYIIIPSIEGKQIMIIPFISGSFIGHYHLWFCYMMVGLYILCPLLKLWVNKKNKKYVQYFLFLSFIFAFLIPQIIKAIGFYTDSEFVNALRTVLNNTNITYVCGFVPYFVLGWYLHNFNIKKTKLVYLVGVLSYLFTVITAFIIPYTTNKNVVFYDNLYVNILLMSAAVFVFIKNKFENKEKPCKAITFTAKYTLGIYAIHVAIIYLLENFVFSALSLHFAPITIPISLIVSFFVSLGISIIMSKIPFLKKLV